MSEVGRDVHGQPDEDRLPWLEPVDEEPVTEGVSAGRLIAGLIVALLVLGLVVGGVYWLKQRATGPQVAAGDGSTIPAPATPYKVRPAEPGGMVVKGQGDSSYAASEGVDKSGRIDLSAVPETPVTRPAATPAPRAAAPVSAPAPQVAVKAPPAATPAPQLAAAKPAAPAVTKPAAPAPASVATADKPAAGGGTVQLGAFASQAKADTAWKSLSGRFAVLAPLSHTVESAEVGGKTVYRLRASGGNARDICAKLKVAGDTCLVVG